jgi:cobalt-zinc-cadmium efflux system membrane fusion protein
VALTRICALVLAAATAAACAQPHDHPAEGEAEVDPISVTRWTEKTELFAEYPPLAVGQVSRFAIHLTRLDTFKPLTAGRVEVRLSGGGDAEVFAAAAPSRPGIFGVDVKPARAGTREMTIVLRLTGLDDEHPLGGVVVHADAAAARKSAEALEGGGDGISFLKEQQWTLDFATAVVGEAAVRESLQVPAVVLARPGGAADVAAPVDGRLADVREISVGAVVSRGQVLARVLPPPESPASRPALAQAVTESRSALELARRDRERAERLVAAGAAPGRRLEEARAAEAQAVARDEGARTRLAQFDSARSAGGASGDAGFLVRAPIGGVIAEQAATTGANVSAGATLFRIVDAGQVQVSGQVPEPELGRARAVQAAEIEIAAAAPRVPAGRLVSLGRVVDPRTRTVPMIFALDNRTLGLAVGQAVSLHLLADQAPPRPVVPVEALVDDGGRPVVYVQAEGETFERRPVTLGPRAGGVVQVLDGVKAGERVVTTGAYLVRLASLSTSAPAHGHVH